MVVPEAAPTPAPSIAQELSGDQEDEKKPRARTESESRQFVVHGSEFPTRAAIASLAEATRAELLKAIGEDEGWQNAIAIQLHGKQGDPTPAKVVGAKFFLVPGGYRLQLDIHLGKGKPAAMERAILDLLLIEHGLRNREARAVDSVRIPAWLVDGMLETFRWRRGERDRDLYAALFKKNQLFPVKKLLEEDPAEMDSMVHSAFRASACALVLSLLEQTGGKQSMRAMLAEIATFEGDEMALLMKHFPGMNLGAESFSKWWALQLAKMAETPFAQVLDIRATERQLQELLVVSFKDPNGNVIKMEAAQFRDLLALPAEERQAAIRPVVERGGRFLYRSFPAHREILMDYLTLLGELAYDKDENVGERLRVLAQKRSELQALGIRTRDYLEWYRITNAKHLTGDFESFIELKENLKSSPSKRRGPVSEHLDSVQRIFDEE